VQLNITPLEEGTLTFEAGVPVQQNEESEKTMSNSSKSRSEEQNQDNVGCGLSQLGIQIPEENFVGQARLSDR